MTDETPELKPCPFCGSGETLVHENKYWTGMRHTVTSAEVRHWCAAPAFKPFLKVAGKTVDEAVARWNTRP